MVSKEKRPDGPDGLHRLHRMLDGAYGGEVPPEDFYGVVILLDALGVSNRGIVQIMGRFTEYPEGQLINDVNGVVAGELSVPEGQLSHIKKLLMDHGYDELANEASPNWAGKGRELNPLDARIPPAAKRHWEALIKLFPRGLLNPKDYVAILAVLLDEGLAVTDIMAVLSAWMDRPRALIAKDIDALGTVLIATDEDKLSMKRRLGLKS